MGFATKVLEEKTEEANQSAMQSIKEKMLIAPAQSGVKEVAVPTVQEIAQAIVKELEKTKQESNEESAWSAFFGRKKED